MAEQDSRPQTAPEIVRVPLINANEDEVTVVHVAVAEGDEIAARDVLCTLETTKATMDVESPGAGFVRRLGVRAGERIRVGELLCVLTPTRDEPVELPGDLEVGSARREVRATNKAIELARQHGVDLADVAADGIVKERDVLAFVRRRDGGRPTPSETPRDADPTPSARGASAAERLVIWGAGGHAKVLIDLVREGHRDWEIIAALDDDEQRPPDVLGVPVIGSSAELERLRADGVESAILGIGAVTNNASRVGLFERLLDHGFRVPNLIHPRAIVERSVRMGRGNQIFAGAIISSGVHLGENTIINSGAVISHDCTIGSHAHVTPGAILAGGVSVGEGSVIGMGASVYLGVRIGRNVVIANGVHVMRDVPDGAVVRSSAG